MCATLGKVRLYVITKGVVSVRVGGLSLSASAQGTSEVRCICLVSKALSWPRLLR